MTSGREIEKDTSAGSEDAAEALARWIADARFEDLDSEDVEATRRIVLDTIATMLAGSSEPPFEKLAAWYRDEGGRPESSILVHGGRVPVRHAAIVNCAMAREARSAGAISKRSSPDAPPTRPDRWATIGSARSSSTYVAWRNSTTCRLWLRGCADAWFARRRDRRRSNMLSEGMNSS